MDFHSMYRGSLGWEGVGGAGWLHVCVIFVMSDQLLNYIIDLQALYFLDSEKGHRLHFNTVNQRLLYYSILFNSHNKNGHRQGTIKWN